LLYLFLKNLFGKTPLALCGTSLFAFDFMHLTQTRIATIDTYAVFFTLAMYFFLWRFLSLPAGTPFRRCAPSLLLSGLMFGLGAACKWTVLYGGAGMAVLYAVNLWQKRRDWPGELTGPTFASWAGKTVLFSVLAFVVLPLCVYVAAYLPYAQARGDTSLSNLLTIVWENQKFMFTYHRGVDATHPYASKWWQWMLDLRPILYYREHTAAGLKSAFAAFNNPVVSWLGLLCMGAVAIKAVRFRSGTALFLLVGYLAQLLPWLPISRPTFAYHYFPATLFLALGIASLMNDLMERPQGRWRLPVYGVTGLNAGLYGLFYPVLIGIPIPAGFSTYILRWLPSWPL
ncbi:MAG: phospholipid carrier-dependent glycosyltransferase, partial [Clostridiales bacterium]|nr:phospholipid carrier-dependent glycosyltransferase [Clostridiales bacterium]